MTAAAGLPGRYVYAVVAAGHRLPPQARGVGTPPSAVGLLTVGAVAAVVGDAPPGLRPRRRDLLAHQELLLALAADGPVAPMRFGTLAPDDEAVRSQLRADGARYAGVLERLAGRLEVNVKALPAADGLPALVGDDAEIRGLCQAVRRRPSYEGNVRLGETVARALTRRAAEAGQSAARALEPLAEAVAAGPPVAGCVLNTSFLVARERVAGFLGRVAELASARRDRVDLRATGPLPCYSFTEPTAPATPVGV